MVISVSDSDGRGSCLSGGSLVIIFVTVMSPLGSGRSRVSAEGFLSKEGKL
jgi:hypothetical protein